MELAGGGHRAGLAEAGRGGEDRRGNRRETQPGSRAGRGCGGWDGGRRSRGRASGAAGDRDGEQQARRAGAARAQRPQEPQSRMLTATRGTPGCSNAGCHPRLPSLSDLARTGLASPQPQRAPQPAQSSDRVAVSDSSPVARVDGRCLSRTRCPGFTSAVGTVRVDEQRQDRRRRGDGLVVLSWEVASCRADPGGSPAAPGRHRRPGSRGSRRYYLASTAGAPPRRGARRVNFLGSVSVPTRVSLSSPRMKASTRLKAMSSWSWMGGLFLK